MNGIGISLQGQYKVAVVDGNTGNEVWRQPEWENNLILNQGLDAIASFTFAQTFEYGVAGTGVRFNNILGGESSGSAINGFFRLLPVGSGIQDLNSTTYGGWVGGVLQVGDLIKFADSSEVSVTGVGDVSASLSQNVTVASQSFSIWKTSQTSLQNETKRAGVGQFGTVSGTAYYVGEDGCGWTTSSYNHVHLWRTYDFAVESSLQNYTEVGVAWDTNDSPSNSTFARMLLPSAIQVGGSQRLRLIYRLNIRFTPESASYVENAPVSGWPVAPSTNTNITQSLQRTSTSSTNLMFFSRPNPQNGSSINARTPFDPSTIGEECSLWGSTNSQSLAQLGSGSVPNRTTVAYQRNSVAEPYVIGSYKLVKYATFPTYMMNHTDLRTFGFGLTSALIDTCYTATGQAFAVYFDQPQSKYSTEEFTLKFMWSWNRELSN